jgi:hypothetical protein
MAQNFKSQCIITSFLSQWSSSVSLVSALEVLTSIKLFPGIIVYLQDVIGFLRAPSLFSDSLRSSRVASVSLKVGHPVSMGSEQGMVEERPVELLVLRLVEEWRLFFFFFEKRLLERLGEQSAGGSGERLFCRLVGRLSGRSGE